MFSINSRQGNSTAGSRRDCTAYEQGLPSKGNLYEDRYDGRDGLRGRAYGIPALFLRLLRCKRKRKEGKSSSLARGLKSIRR
jgi:hypothetical protein